MREEEILVSAEFDPRLPTYFMLQALLVLLISLFGAPLIPIWFIFGKAIHRRQYEAMGCDLTPRSLNVRTGFLFKVQKNIPLDKITDLAVNEGPVLRYLGLCSMRIETAGGGNGSTMGQAVLPGVVDALGFRDRVLDQRDAVARGIAPIALTDVAEDGVLVEIRDTLKNIESHLTSRS
jgi:putative membrane protein